MKSKKVLLGLFVGLLACTAGSAMGQTKANFQSDRLIEVGPNNIGGRVRTVVVDNSDASNKTLYAGGVAGGLYTKQADDAEWTYIPYFAQGNVELTLPISSMIQLPDHTIIIGTGESQYQHGFNFKPMSPLGRGIYRFNPEDNTFSVIQNTVPSTTADKFAYVNKMAFMQNGNTLYFFVATDKGLYRWNITGADSWNAQPTTVFNGVVEDIEVNALRNMAFFTSGSNLYKIGNVTAGSNPVNISGTNEAFAAPNTRIELALAPSNSSYLYALVFNEDFSMENLYLTKDQQTWTKLCTRTVAPFTRGLTSGANSGALVVDPSNADRVFIGGSSLWIGQGYVEGSFYQWTKSSYSEFELNGGNYMSDVFSNTMFVHSGIHDVVSARDTATGIYTYYIATDGGLFRTSNDFVSYQNINRGMNISQINGLAVCPDGSILAGAHSNGCPFIEARLAHYGGHMDTTWYDQGSTANHVANITWTGNGGQVASSMFQQYAPMSRRYIFTSAEGGQLGRAYADYADYTNTQTWTAMEEFASSLPTGGNDVTQMVLWETKNNTIANDTIAVKLDTNMTSRGIRNGELGNWQMHEGATIKHGDTIRVFSSKNVYYPIDYVVPEDFTMTEGMTLRIQNPLQSRLFAVVKSNLNQKSTVMMNWYPTDASKVWRDADQENYDVIMNWSRVLMTSATDSSVIHAIAVSNDGNTLFATIDDPLHNTSMLVRISGFNYVDYSETMFRIRQQMNYDLNDYVLSVDTLQVFDRMITSLTVNPRPNTDGLVITFGGYDNDKANVVYLNNATAETYEFKDRSLTSKALPAYSAMVEYTTGEVYVGTEDGVFVANASSFNGTGNASWQEYGAFRGVPVTAMYQQTRTLPVERYYQHNGASVDTAIFAKTKYPYAMYFGTYGRGIFMDSTYVTDHENEIVNPEDLDIPQLNTVGANSVSVYPNPASFVANVDINIANAGNAVIKVYDLSGKLVMSEVLGNLSEGEYTHAINCQNLRKGMYLVNVVVGRQSAATKLVVR